MKISDRVILPLVGSAFQSGKAAEAFEKIEVKELAQIAQGEYYFFSALAEKCVETVKDYLDHDDVRREIAANGYQRIRQEYSYQARLALMLDVRHSLSI